MYNNEQVSKVFSKISAETCLKMDYFGCKFKKIAKRWGLRPQTPLPPAAGASPTDPVQVQ